MTSLIHMGMSKSASTFLQSKFFDQNDNFYYSGLFYKSKYPNYYSIKELHDLTLMLVNQDQFIEVPKKLLNMVNSEYHKSIDQKKIFVFSNEHFCESVNPFFQASLIKQVFKDPKIILIIRNQYDIIRSHYLYQGNKLLFVPNKYKGKHVNFKSYFNYLLFTKNKNGGHKARDWIYDYLRIINYNNFLKINEKIFGKENIIVAPFEEIIKNPNTIYDYLEQKINYNFIRNKVFDKNPVRSSVSNRGLKIINLSKFFLGDFDKNKNSLSRNIVSKLKSSFPNLHQSLIRGGGNMNIPNDILFQINELFKDGNNELSHRYNINLKDLGYPS